MHTRPKLLTDVGVNAIHHTASPIDMSLTSLEAFLEPATKGVSTILDSAKAHAGPQLSSFTLTSSVAAVVDYTKTNTAYEFSEADWNDKAEGLARGFTSENFNPGVCYAASKTAAERTLWSWVEKNRPDFSISAVNPGIITGPPVHLPSSPDKLNETLKPIWGIFSGRTQEVPLGIGSQSYIDVRDVSAMHIWCQEHPEASDGQRYLMTNGRGTMQAAADILRKAYPKNGIVTGNPGSDYVEGYGFPSGMATLRATKAYKAIGVRSFIGYDKSMLDTAKVFERYLGQTGKV